MKQEINLLKVPFFGAELLLVEHNEQPYVVMKTITESIGLSWQGQHEKLLEHFSKGIKEILIPTNGGVQQMICMNLRKFPAWLYSLQPKKISDPIKRAKIIAFKEECDEVLWQYWTTGIATRETVKEKLAEIFAKYPDDTIDVLMRISSEIQDMWKHMALTGHTKKKKP